MVDGTIGSLRGDLQHFSNDSINSHVRKIIPFSDEFIRQKAGHVPGMLELMARPFWRFIRAYFLRLGFLDGWQGYYIACLNSFSAATRYAKLRELDLLQKEKK